MNLIAELCQNHNGSIEILLKMIKVAKANGATHAKIQGLYSSEITNRKEFNNKQNEIYRPFNVEIERIRKLELSFETEKLFVLECNRLKITPMITVFTHEGAIRAQKAGFTSIKIASYDCASLPLIKNCLKFATELVISTGATYWGEVEQTARYLHIHKKPEQKIAFLHARTIYPTPLNQVGLARMLALRFFGFDIGFSDHSMPEQTELIASKFAITLGANYLERHFTILDRDLTKDGPVSINPSDLNELSRFSQMDSAYKYSSLLNYDLNEILHLDSLEPTKSEIINRKYYRGRVASLKNGQYVFSWEEYEKET